MSGGESRGFSESDETRTPDKTTVELVSLGGGQVGRYAWVTGDEPAVVVELPGAVGYAKPS
jgi:hypothetical protein